MVRLCSFLFYVLGSFSDPSGGSGRTAGFISRITYADRSDVGGKKVSEPGGYDCRYLCH